MAATMWPARRSGPAMPLGGAPPGWCRADEFRRPLGGVVPCCYIYWMNGNFGEMKIRVRKLDERLLADPGLIHGRLDFAAAVSRARRLLRDGDRSREPSAVLRAAVEKAELLGRGIP